MMSILLKLRDIRILKIKPFGVFASIDIIISVKSLLNETTKSIDALTPNGLSLGRILCQAKTRKESIMCDYSKEIVY